MTICHPSLRLRILSASSLDEIRIFLQSTTLLKLWVHRRHVQENNNVSRKRGENNSVLLGFFHSMVENLVGLMRCFFANTVIFRFCLNQRNCEASKFACEASKFASLVVILFPKRQYKTHTLYICVYIFVASSRICTCFFSCFMRSLMSSISCTVSCQAFSTCAAFFFASSFSFSAC
jgi:hypothetical protein